VQRWAHEAVRIVVVEGQLVRSYEEWAAVLGTSPGIVFDMVQDQIAVLGQITRQDDLFDDIEASRGCRPVQAEGVTEARGVASHESACELPWLGLLARPVARKRSTLPVDEELLERLGEHGYRRATDQLQFDIGSEPLRQVRRFATVIKRRIVERRFTSLYATLGLDHWRRRRVIEVANEPGPLLQEVEDVHEISVAGSIESTGKSSTDAVLRSGTTGRAPAALLRPMKRLGTA